MDEVIQYRKVTNFNLIINISNMLLWTSTWLQDQKAGGGRLIYKGIKLNNRTMHNFRPTIGKLLNTVSRRFIWPSFVICAHCNILHCWEIVCLCEMSWTCYKKSCLLGHFVYETVCLLSGQFVSTYNICFATRVAWWKGNIFVTVLNVMNNISKKICSCFFNAIANVTLSKFPQCPRESCESWSRCPCCWPPGMWPLAAGPRDPEPGDTPARPRPWCRHVSDDW